MTERITEANLDTLEACASAPGEDLLRREDVLSLVAEVRRLRGLIAACEVQDGGFLPRDFEAEVRAIHEETKS